MIYDTLTGPANDIRKEIKQMIPETTSSSRMIPEQISPDQSSEIQAKLLDVNEHGTKTYGGELLMDKISRMKDEMKIDGRWGYHLVHFPIPTKLLNEERRQGYVIPLNDLTLTPGGVLEEGTYTYITDDPTVSPGATAVFLLPY